MRFSTVFIRRLSQGKSAEQCILAKKRFSGNGGEISTGEVSVSCDGTQIVNGNVYGKIFFALVMGGIRKKI